MSMFSNFKSSTIKIQGLLHQLASIKPEYKLTSYFCVTNHWSKYKGELQWTCLEFPKTNVAIQRWILACHVTFSHTIGMYNSVDVFNLFYSAVVCNKSNTCHKAELENTLYTFRFKYNTLLIYNQISFTLQSNDTESIPIRDLQVFYSEIVASGLTWYWRPKLHHVYWTLQLLKTHIRVRKVVEANSQLTKSQCFLGALSITIWRPWNARNALAWSSLAKARMFLTFDKLILSPNGDRINGNT